MPGVLLLVTMLCGVTWMANHGPQFNFGDDGYVLARHPAMHSVEQLYDLHDDPLEQRDLIAAHGLIVTNNGQPQPLLGAKGTRAAAQLRPTAAAARVEIRSV